MPPLYVVEQNTRLSVEQRRLQVHRDGVLLLQTLFAHIFLTQDSRASWQTVPAAQPG